MGVAAVGVILTLLAFTFDAAPLFVPGVAFALIGVLVPAWVYLAATSAHVERRLLADRVVEGEPVEAMIEVTRGPLGLPGGEVRDPLAGMPVSVSRPLSIITGACEGGGPGRRPLPAPRAAPARAAGARGRRHARARDPGAHRGRPHAGAARAPADRAGEVVDTREGPPPGGRQRRAGRRAARRGRHRRTAPVPARDVGLADPLGRARPRSRTARAPAAG